jgi:anthranilate synthase component 2/putative glutamine amidotransferase
VTGVAADGTIEAVEVKGHAFAWGVQWHPEDDPTDDRVVAALANAAAHHLGLAPAPGRGVAGPAG